MLRKPSRGIVAGITASHKQLGKCANYSADLLAAVFTQNAGNKERRRSSQLTARARRPAASAGAAANRAEKESSPVEHVTRVTRGT